MSARLTIMDTTTPAHTHEFYELLSIIEELKKRIEALESPECTAKRRPKTLEEVVSHCAKVGLPESDAKWLWAHMEVSGWRNNGKVVRSWTALVTSWKLANIFPSQKRNGNGQHSIRDLQAIIEAKKQEKDELVRKHYNDSGAFHNWTNEPARQRFIVLKREIINLTSEISKRA